MTADPAILITRPKAQSAALAAVLKSHRYRPVIAPMLDITPVASAPDLGGVAALVFTSANGVAALPDEIPRDFIVFTVGGATATAALDAGFADVRTGDGDGAALVPLIEASLNPAAGKILHLCGEDIRTDIAALLAGKGYSAERITLYRATAAASLGPAADEIKSGKIAAVLFFSPRTARSFVKLAEEAGLGAACGQMAAICLSDAVAAEATKLGWSRIIAAKSPQLDAMIATLDDTVRHSEN